jgi:CheY-like chemotaxis protein
LLAGRKLLLADDSITIQKVVELTFADEGVSVVCVGNGRDAIEWLAEFTPDIVLADVFMPQVSGYEVCEYIKQSEKLKHIPVMLLVGSFEPFDEGEARRVGANDTLTKPFQSIRRLIDKVGQLVSGRSAEEQIPTAELPKPEAVAEPEVEKLTTAELEISTADTKPLPPELKHVVDNAASQAVGERAEIAGEAEHALVAESRFDQGAMKIGENGENGVESRVMETRNEVVAQYEGAGEVLLDLGDIQTANALDEDFVLDIDLDEAPEPSPAEPAFSTASLHSRQRFSPSAGAPSAATITADLPARSADPMAVTQEFHHDFGAVVDAEVESAPAVTFPEVPVMEAAVESDTAAIVATPESAAFETVAASPATVTASPVTGAAAPAFVTAAPASQVSAQQLSPEMIDAIAKRVVEHMSATVVQEIAWEVVPQLAELLIKRQLEEKNS